jgi:hypothetical protein
LARKLSTHELIGWMAFGAALLAAFVMLGLGAPRRAIDVALGLCFLFAIPLCFRALRREWRGD